MRFGCLVVSSKVLLLSLGPPVCGSNAQFKFTSSSGGYFHKEHLTFRWIHVSFKQGNTKEKVGLFCDQYRFRDDHIISLLLLTSCKVYVLTPIGNFTYDYEPLVRIGIRKLKEDFLSALIDI